MLWHRCTFIVRHSVRAVHDRNNKLDSSRRKKTRTCRRRTYNASRYRLAVDSELLIEADSIINFRLKSIYRLSVFRPAPLSNFDEGLSLQWRVFRIAWVSNTCFTASIEQMAKWSKRDATARWQVDCWIPCGRSPGNSPFIDFRRMALNFKNSSHGKDFFFFISSHCTLFGENSLTAIQWRVYSFLYALRWSYSRCISFSSEFSVCYQSVIVNWFSWLVVGWYSSVNRACLSRLLSN